MILTMTCFTRIAVVLGMTRTALGTQSAAAEYGDYRAVAVFDLCHHAAGLYADVRGRY